VPLIAADAGARAFVAEVTSDDVDGDVTVLVTAGDPALFAPARGDRYPAEIHVSARSHPYLADHSIGDDPPVAPLAVVLEWLAGGLASRPGHDDKVVLHDVAVLRKLSLPHFDGAGHRLRVRLTTEPGGDIELRVIGPSGHPHFRAVASSTRPAPGRWPEPDDLGPMAGEIYDGHTLFHGPSFHAVHRVNGISAAGASGDIVGATALGWPEGRRWTDPAAVDGALQLAVLWARNALNVACLPMHVSEYRLHRTGPLDGPARCVVRARAVRDGVAECDLAVLGADEIPVVEMLGVRLVARPR
jgi:hypothetical protein